MPSKNLSELEKKLTDAFVAKTLADFQSKLLSLCSEYGHDIDVRDFFTADTVGLIHKTKMSLDEYRSAIHELWKFDCDLDLQDIHGKTPLHYAAVGGNAKVVGALLASGSDPNLLDDNEASVFSHLVHCRKELNLPDDKFSMIVSSFCNYFRVMQLMGIYIHPVNVKAYEKACFFAANDLFGYSNIKMLSDDVLGRDIEKLATVQFGQTPICLNEILFEKTIVRYPRMIQEKRRAIDDFFHNNVKVLDDFSHPTMGVILFQYRKALARKDLCEKAMDAFESLTEFNIPVLCIDLIFSYLVNHELICLIKAADCKI